MFQAKKRHRHAELNVSFMNNPEAERQGHLLNCYQGCNMGSESPNGTGITPGWYDKSGLWPSSVLMLLASRFLVLRFIGFGQPASTQKPKSRPF